ncbi:MAG: hypothetical protein ABIF77_01670, partial [bacterium]
RLPGGLIAQIDAGQDNSETKQFIVQDCLDCGTGLEEGASYRYRVTATDAVGLAGTGSTTSPVVPDTTAPAQPSIEILCDHVSDEGVCYIQGTEIVIRGTGDTPEGSGTEFIWFEAARDSVQFLDTQFQPGHNYFPLLPAEWIPYHGGELDQTFQLLPPNQNPNFCNGHRYFCRARIRDLACNESTWSEIVSAVMDAFPPEDVQGLSVTPQVDESGAYSMLLDWEQPIDHVSGLKELLVYRKVEGSGFVPIATLPAADAPPFLDDLHDLDGVHSAVCYKISSRDQVGNERPEAQANSVRCARIPVAPFIELVDCHAVIDDTLCVVDLTHATIAWPGYDAGIVDYFVVTVNEIETAQIDGAETSFDVPTPENGFYRIFLNAFFDDGSTSYPSNQVTAYADGTPPAVITDLAVSNDSTVRFDLTWTEPSDDTGVLEYRVHMQNLDQPDDLRTFTVDTPGLWIPFDDTIYTFHRFRFLVQAVDLVGNECAGGSNPVESYCNRAPDLEPGCPDEGCRLTLCWRPGAPNASAAWRSVVEVVDESQQVVERVTVPNAANCRGFTLPGEGYHGFRVKIVPDDLTPLESAWSARSWRSCNQRPPAVEDLVLQPQPLLVCPEDGAHGEIDLYWTFPHCDYLGGISHFLIIRTSTSTVDTLDLEPATCPDSEYQIRDAGLLINTIYTYAVAAIDDQGCVSEFVSSYHCLDPVSAYTPKILAPTHFRSIELPVQAVWECSCDTTSTCGASQFELQVSRDFSGSARILDFGPFSATANTQVLDASSLGLHSGTVVTIRSRAQEGHGWHCSPWNDFYNDFCGLDHELSTESILDDSPPWPVTELEITTHASATAAVDSVDVVLQWSGVSDRPNNGIGGVNYRIYRNDVYLAEVRIGTTYTDVNFPVVDTRDTHFEVRAVDELGNERLHGNAVAPIPPLSLWTDLVA